MRKITSLTAALSFITLLITSVVLYIVPHGRVAYWADWQLWGLSKTEWGDMHTTVGVLFCLAVFLHIYYNWIAMISYMKKSKQLRIFTKEFNVALVVTVITISGTYFTLPPFSWILDLAEQIKQQGAQKYGNPPYGHAELSSLKTICKRMGLDLVRAQANLKGANIVFGDENNTLISISKANNMTPQKVYELMQSNENKAKSKGDTGSCRGAKAPVTNTPNKMGHGLGIGKMSIDEICHRSGFDLTTGYKRLDDKGYNYSKSDLLKDIASKNKITPYTVYEVLLGDK